MEAPARKFYASSTKLRDFDIAKFVDLWEGFLKNGIGAIFLALEDERIVGAIGGIFHREAYSDERVCQEFFWFIELESRGEGFRLYRAFEKWAREQGCNELRMVHLIDSMPDKVALFYQRMGYSKTEVLYSKRLDVAEMRRAG